MKPATSLFLDILRVFAALVVFSYHCSIFLFSGAFWVPGHAAVVVFFVLSGYVITAVTLSRETTLRKYVIARLTRLYSVVLPALALTGVLMLAGHFLRPQAYSEIIRNHDSVRFLATAFYLQSIWWWNLSPSGDRPFWSLGYEFWYYVLFAICFFMRGWRWKIALASACCLFVGPNVVLLFPIWLLGAALYIYRDRFPLPRSPAAVLCVAAAVICGVLPAVLPDFPARVGYPPLFYSGAFVSDWILGLSIGVLVWSFDQAWGNLAPAGAGERAIRWAANHTFSLYLFHEPLLVFVNALGFFDPHVWWNAVLEIALVLGIIVLLSELTESQRKRLQRLVTNAVDQFAGQRKPSAAAS